MNYTGSQLRDLHEAIMEGFTHEDLNQLLRFRLNTDLDAIVASHQSFQDTAFEVIQHFQRQGTLVDLINAVATARSDNQRVRALLERLHAAEPSVLITSDPHDESGLTAGASTTLKMTGPQLIQLRDAIKDAFSINELGQLARFDLNVNLHDIVAPHQSLERTVFDVVQYAEQQGEVANLIRAVAKERPGNSRVRAMLEAFGVTSDASDVEQTLLTAAPQIDIQAFRAKLIDLEKRVCRVEIEGPDGPPKPYGTGFLVGPDLVMTSFHVLIDAQAAASEPALYPATLQFRFDFKGALGGIRLTPGTVFKSAATNWLVTQWPFQQEADLDYAIVRLDQKVESERGYIRIPTQPPPITPGMPLSILQHPLGGPLKLALEMDGVIDASPDRRFIFHRVSTQPKSSGSPVFNADLYLIGLHRGRDEDRKTAIAMSAIANDLRRQNIPVGDLEHRTDMKGGATACAATDEISQRLRDYRPDAEISVPTEPPALDAYRKAAAVLIFFDMGKLKPLPPAKADERALVRLMSECSLRAAKECGPRYSLNPEMRRVTIDKMSARDLRRALKLNREFPEDLPQRMFSALVLDEPLPEIGVDVQRLRDLLQAVTMLQGKVRNLPNAKLLRQRLAREELLAPHRHLAGNGFCGRDYELFRLSALLDGDQGKPLLVHGVGGTGKSALLGRFILDRHEGIGPWSPFVFLDFDRPILAAEEEITFMTETVRQLSTQFPELSPEAARLVKSWERQVDKGREPRRAQKKTPRSHNRRLARYSLTEAQRATIRREFLHFLRRLLLPGDRLLVVLDTFEEVQVRSNDAVDSFWNFLTSLINAEPALRVVVSGRAEAADRPVDQLPLGDLDPKDAANVIVAGGVPRDAAAKVVELVGGNPLCLRLALQVLHRDGLAALHELAANDLGVAGEIRSQLMQGWLYRRVLGHVHDDKISQLAFPGLTVRRIDPEVIRVVLAEPCGLIVPDDAAALDLFERLSREVALVQPGRAGALYHLQSVRRLMLRHLRTDAVGQFDVINRKAVEFYSAKNADHTTTDLAARAEEIYHRLALGQPIAEIQPLWLEGVEEYLRGAVEDFTEIEPATFLASRLGVELPPDLWDRSRIEEWELHAAKRAQDLLALNDPKKALTVITGRPERTAASPLFLLEARLRFQLGERDAAIRLAGAAVKKAGAAATGAAATGAAANDSTRLELLLFLGDALWLTGEHGSALATAGDAVAVAERLRDPMPAIDARTRQLRFGRALNVLPAATATIRSELARCIKRLPSTMTSYRHLLQYAVVEVLPDDVEAFHYGVRAAGVLRERPRMTEEQVNRVKLLLGHKLAGDPDVIHALGTYGVVQRDQNQDGESPAEVDHLTGSIIEAIVVLLIDTPVLTRADTIAELRLWLERPLPVSSSDVTALPNSDRR